MTDQPAEATQPRLWLGTVTWAHGATEHDVPLWGFDPEWGYTAPTRDAYFTPAQVTDLRPAVVVPQQEDGGEVERLAEVAYSAAWDAVSGKGDPWEDADPCTREDYRGVVRAVLAAQRPAASVGDELRAFVTDLAEHGLRADLTPTIDMRDAYGHLTAYLRRIDAGLRERARTALAETPAAPVAVDEATVARVLGEHFGDWLDEDSAFVGCACGVICPAGFASHRTHLATELVRALAARDEGGGAS